MMHTIRICVLMAIGAVLASCSTTSERNPIELPEHRPSDFTLGVVVFGDPDSTEPAIRSARYIIEPDGTLRASFGEGSDGLTYPPITRRLNEDQLDLIWEMSTMLISSTQGGGSLGSGFWTEVQAPELFKRSDFRGQELGAGYLLEIKANGEWRAWESYMFLGGPTGFVEMLANLAWVTD